MGGFDGIMGACYESRPDGTSFPCGVPEHVNPDTRLYTLLRPASVAGHKFEHVITRYDRETDRTEAYFTSARWDFSRHGPMVECVNGCGGRAAHRKVMKRAGFAVEERPKRKPSAAYLR